MEPEFAFAEGADRFAVNLDVGDEQNFLVILLDSLGPAAQRLRRLLAVAELAEIGSESQLQFLGDGLAAEYQHQVLAPGLLDRPHRPLRQFPRQVDAADLRAAGGRQGSDGDVHDVLH